MEGVGANEAVGNGDGFVPASYGAKDTDFHSVLDVKEEASCT
jgi:hypothetical protein